MEEKNCPGCGNQCPADNLSCGKGRRYFGNAPENGGRREHGFKESSDEVVNLLLKCGHTLHHSHGNVEVRLDCLTSEERVQLTALLKKCLKELQN